MFNCSSCAPLVACCFFFFDDPATTEIYTLSLHDALPICIDRTYEEADRKARAFIDEYFDVDRKSTRLNSSHEWISYAVFCSKKKKNNARYVAAEMTTYVDRDTAHQLRL